MSGEQKAMLVVLASVLAYPTWCLIKAAFWASVDRWSPEPAEVLDEQAETYGPAQVWGPVAETPIPFIPTDVVPMDAGLLTDWHTRDHALTDGSIASTLNAWSLAAAAHPYIDHTPCEGDDCDRVICCCPLSEVGLTCPGTVEQACTHHTMLCDECRPGCVDCRIDAAHDVGGL